MSLILNIDTAVDTASACLAKDGEVLQLISNQTQKDHASWLHIAIAKLLQHTGYSLADVRAVAVSIGPGSYTGLRIGLSTAKGICYAMKIPLIAIGTLDMMAFAGKDGGGDLICPLVDARRMEVFAAVYDRTLRQIIPPHAVIVNENSFAELLSGNKILFLGNGSKKLQDLVSNANALVTDKEGNAAHLAKLSIKSFFKSKFADLASTQPLYVKEFYSSDRKPLL